MTMLTVRLTTTARSRSNSVSNSDDVVDRIESATLSGGNSNDLLLMQQASEIAQKFIESENV